MKTINLLKIATVLLIGIAINSNAQAGSDKLSRSVRLTTSQMTHTIKLDSEDIKNMQLLLTQSDAVQLVWNNHELKLVHIGDGIPSDTIVFEANDEVIVEDWMFESEYLNEETAGNIQAWMTDTNYLNEAIKPVEPWMFDSNYLSR